MQRVALIVLVSLAVMALGAAAEGQAEGQADAKDLNLDDIEKIDSSVFNEDAESPVAKSPIEQAASAVVSARDADVDADTESVIALAAESARTGGEDQTMYSFRAMRHASEMAGTSVTEKSRETHEQAMRMLRGPRVSSEELFAEVSREQQILVAKRALVAHQKQSIAESVESLRRLKGLIGENKRILQKNEKALRRGGDDLVKLIAKYQSKLKAGLKPAAAPAPKKPKAKPAKKNGRAAFKRWGAHKAAKPAAAKKPAAKPAAKKPAAKAAKKAAPAAAAKAKFVQVHEEDEEADADADADAEEGAEETDSEEESEEEADSESEADAEAEGESEEETEEDEEVSADVEAEEETESASLLEKIADAAEADEATYDPAHFDRSPAIAGLAAPPHLYNPEDDTFV